MNYLQQQAITFSSLKLINIKLLIFLPLSGILSLLLNTVVFTPGVLSQTSISLPKTETETSPIQETTPQKPLNHTDNNLEIVVPTENENSALDYQKARSSQFNVYRLAAGDGLNISVPEFPEFNAVATIDGEGTVIIPMLGRISLAGLSLTEVEQKISYELGQQFLQSEPKVLATLTTPRSAQITVLGEIVKPGFYSFTSGSPLVAALQAAGGSTQEADLRSVIVRRALVDGTQIEEKVDLYTPLIKGEGLPEVRLQGGDTVIIPKLEIGKDLHYDRALIAKSNLPQQNINVRVLAPATTGTAFRNLVLPNGSTFIDAIASLPPDDNLLVKKEVALLRFNPETGKIITQELNAQDVIHGDIAQNIPLQNEDVIVVSRTLLGKVFNAFSVITQPIQTFFGFRTFFENFAR